MTRLELAKERLDIPQLAELRGWDWKPGRACRVPYRPDRKQSGSVLPCRTLFHDFATGQTLDAPGLLSRVEEIDIAAACRLFIELAGVAASEVHSATPARRAAPTRPVRRKKPQLPALTKPDREEIASVVTLRRVSFEAVELAARRGVLFSAKWHGTACWALTDCTRWLCQFRRMDGELFSRGDGTRLQSLDGARKLGCMAARRRGSPRFSCDRADGRRRGFSGGVSFHYCRGPRARCFTRRDARRVATARRAGCAALSR